MRANAHPFAIRKKLPDRQIASYDMRNAGAIHGISVVKLLQHCIHG